MTGHVLWDNSDSDSADVHRCWQHALAKCEACLHRRPFTLPLLLHRSVLPLQQFPLPRRPLLQLQLVCRRPPSTTRASDAWRTTFVGVQCMLVSGWRRGLKLRTAPSVATAIAVAEVEAEVARSRSIDGRPTVGIPLDNTSEFQSYVDTNKSSRESTFWCAGTVPLALFRGVSLVTTAHLERTRALPR